jgi:hypothetical protein
MTTGHAEQLTWERSAGRYAAGAAALSGALLLVGSVYFNTTVRERPRGIEQELALLARESTNLLVSGVLVALGFLLLAVVLGYLYRVTKHRRSQLPTAALALLVFGAVVAAVAEVGRQIAVLAVASDFLATGPRTAARARGLLRGSTGLQVLGVAGLAANFALGLTIALICINAMRAGVLSAFMGIFGTLVGVLSVIAPPAFRGVVFVLLFLWLVALGLLFLDRWPGGRGPAWATGEAARWPSVAERNEQLQREREELDAGPGREGEGSGTTVHRDSPAGGGEGGDRPEAARSESAANGGSNATGNGGEPSQPAKRKRRRRR